MASAISPRSPMLSTAITSPLEFLPVTRFPVDENVDAFQKSAIEKEKEREVIQTQPYRTTQLVYPQPKAKPDFVDNKSSGKKPTVFRPLEQANLVGNLNQNQAVVHRQFNSPRPIYSQQNVAEAVYVQTGYNVGPQSQQNQSHLLPTFVSPPVLPKPSPQSPRPTVTGIQQHLPVGQPVHMIPDSLPEFNPQKSPTFRAIIEMEGLGTLQPAPSTMKAPPQLQQKIAHSTTPTAHLNSVGMPNDRIAQSHSFRRLMLNLTQ